MDKHTKILDRMKEHYKTVENQGYEIVGLFLQGSQNYELDYEGSDIDTKAIVLPKFEDFLKTNKPISFTYIMENEEHVDIKDIRVMFENIKKQNINFVEILFSKYFIINEKYKKIMFPLFEQREKIARYNIYAALSCMTGMAMEKHKALEHRYPSTEIKIDKFGYDPKQLHHIIRLYEFMKRYIEGDKYSDCLISKHKENLIDIKKGILPLQTARALADLYNTKIYELKSNYFNSNISFVDKEVEEIMNSCVLKAIKKYFKEEIGKEDEL